MLIECNVNIACYMLHFVLLNEAVCIKPLQYHMYGLFLLSLNRARPLRRTTRLHPPVNFVTPAVFGNDYNKKLGVFIVEWKLFTKSGGNIDLFQISSLISFDVFLYV